MALTALALPARLMPFVTSFGATPAYLNITAAGYWTGLTFIAPVTDTITALRIWTGTVSSPVFTLEAAITALDASGYPLGADISAGDLVTNPAATTDYVATLSASVTKGSIYGAIVRVKATTYTSGSANVVSNMAAYDTLTSVGNQLGYPFACTNGGSNSKLNKSALLAIKYSTAGWTYTPGTMLGSAAGYGSLSIAATSGNATGNRFVLPFRCTISGYALEADIDNPANAEMYSGSDNTAISGSDIALTAAYRHSAAPGTFTVLLPTPITLDPGTYRIAVRNTSAAANTIRRISALAEAGMTQVIAPSGMYQSAYASGAWTDTDTAICAITPIISAVDDGLGEVLGGSSL